MREAEVGGAGGPEHVHPRSPAASPRGSPGGFLGGMHPVPHQGGPRALVDAVPPQQAADLQALAPQLLTAPLAACTSRFGVCFCCCGMSSASMLRCMHWCSAATAGRRACGPSRVMAAPLATCTDRLGAAPVVGSRCWACEPGAHVGGVRPQQAKAGHRASGSGNLRSLQLHYRPA